MLKPTSATGFFWNWACLALVSLSAGIIWSWLFLERPTAALALEIKAPESARFQFFYDLGEGIREDYSTWAYVAPSKDWRKFRLSISKVGRLQNLRIDPSTNDAKVSVRRLALIGADGRELASLDTGLLRPANQIEALHQDDGGVMIVPTVGANDPYLTLTIPPVALEKAPWPVVPPLTVSLVFAVLVVSISHLLRSSAAIKMAGYLSARPIASVALTAVAAALISSAAVVFAGKSYLSPGYPGLALIYDAPPTLPDYPTDHVERVYNADLGAMLWQHFAYSVLEARAVKDDLEFPLWNRYNAAGRTLIGQGQSMLGDPLNWVVLALGPNAGAFDFKFVVLKVFFAISIGAGSWLLTRSLTPAVFASAASCFISYFLYRVNHAAIFSLCYAPSVLVAWIGLAKANSTSARWWLAALVGANWLLLSSGTAKEAYMLWLSLNLMGTAYLLMASRRESTRVGFRRAALALAAMACFFVISTPVWATFVSSVRNGWNVYQHPAVQQMAVSQLLGFGENIFFLLGNETYMPALNMALFCGMVVAFVVHFRRVTPHGQDEALTRVLIVGMLGCLAFAFGVVPASWILAIPILKSIHHIHNTFSTVALVPACLLASSGYQYLLVADGNCLRRTVHLSGLLLSILLVLFLTDPAVSQWRVIAYLAGTISALAFMVWLIRRRLIRGMRPWAVGAAALCFLVLLGRGATWGETSGRADRYLLNAQPRANLLPNDIVVSAARQSISDPVRTVGIGGVVFTGYRGALGFESIGGTDAIENRRFRDVTDAFQFPMVWSWLMYLKTEDLRRFGKALDFLNVGLVFSNEPLNSVPGLTPLAEEPRLRAYRRLSPWPRAFFTDTITPADDLAGLVDAVNHAFGPFVQIDASDIANSTDLQTLAQERSYTAVVRPARAYHLTANSTEFEVDATGPGIAYLGEANEPGDFLVSVNGKAATYFSANHAFKAVYLPAAGTYRIRATYSPAHLGMYLGAAVAGLVAFVGLLAVSTRLLDSGCARPSRNGD
jgi:hypothetical protein